MEQQTISIAKAGIQATLMARTSVLAAANPVYGRYDKTKSLKYNINISAPIMSRFDLFYVIVDERDDYNDNHIANHIVNLHRLYGLQKNEMHIGEEEEKLEKMFKVDFSQEQLLLYIRFAKQLNPKFTKEAAIKLREEYTNLRQNDISYQRSSYRITVRQLESLIRLSEALARVHLDDNIYPTYVSEAARLLKTSIITVEMPNIELEFEKNIQEERRKYDQNISENLMMIDNDQLVEKRKIVISGPEYEKLKSNIIMVVREFEAQGKDIKLIIL
jgi:DNA replication licensing factor MCM6